MMASKPRGWIPCAGQERRNTDRMSATRAGAAAIQPSRWTTEIEEQSRDRSQETCGPTASPAHDRNSEKLLHPLAQLPDHRPAPEWEMPGRLLPSPPMSARVSLASQARTPQQDKTQDHCLIEGNDAPIFYLQLQPEKQGSKRKES
jgi:hypothetical protein